MSEQLEQMDSARLQYLEEYRVLVEASLGAITLCLSDGNTDKSACLEIMEMWRLKLAQLHTRWLNSLPPAPEDAQNLAKYPDA